MVAEDFLDHDFCLPSVTARTGSDLEIAPSLSSAVAANDPLPISAQSTFG
jgi:hypothetical protein